MKNKTKYRYFYYVDACDSRRIYILDETNHIIIKKHLDIKNANYIWNGWSPGYMLIPKSLKHAIEISEAEAFIKLL